MLRRSVFLVPSATLIRLILVVVVVVGAGAFVAPARAIAYTRCQPSPSGTLCTSEVDFQTFSQFAFMSQYQSQWCWAASLSMVFSYYGHPVSQERIVSEVYGGPANIPSPGYTIAAQLNRDWIDDFGRPFSAGLTGLYDAAFGIVALSNDQIIQELDRGSPLILGARSHAMVLTAIQYYVTPAGPYVVSAGVFDPWPGIGARLLDPDELFPVHQGGSLRFLATTRVGSGGVSPSRPAPAPGPSPAPSSPSPISPAPSREDDVGCVCVAPRGRSGPFTGMGLVLLVLLSLAKGSQPGRGLRSSRGWRGCGLSGLLLLITPSMASAADMASIYRAAVPSVALLATSASNAGRSLRTWPASPTPCSSRSERPGLPVSLKPSPPLRALKLQASAGGFQRTPKPSVRLYERALA